MAQTNEIATTGATYLGIESAFGETSGSMVRVFPRRGGTRTETDGVIGNETMRSALVNREPDVLGYKTCQSQMAFDARALGARIGAGDSPTRPWQGVPLFGLLGGESIHAGSTVASGSSATVVKVASGDGPLFSVGDGILVTVAGTNEFALIKSISGDDLTLAFALSGIPSNGAGVFACVGYFAKDKHSESLTFQHARAQNAASQWTHRGCTGALSIETPRAGMMGFGVNLRGGAWVGPSAQSIDASEGSQTMSAPLAHVRGFQVLQPIGTTTRTHVPFESIAVSVETGMQLIEETGGDHEGLVGAMRTSFGASADITVRHDSSWRSGWSPSTVYQLIDCVYTGSGTGRGCVAIVMFGTLSETPGYQAGSNDRGVTMLKFRSIGGQLNPSVDSDQARSPFFWMIG